MEEMLGSIKLFAGNFAPRNWVYCYGQLLAISEYSSLYSLLGTYYGGDGRNTFAVPDLRGRVPVGSGAGPGRTPRNIGQYGGYERVQLSTDQLPAHTHGVNCDTTTAGRSLKNTPADNLCATDAEGNSYGSTASVQMNPSMIQATGNGVAHENMQPWQCINYIICINGYYPSRS